MWNKEVSAYTLCAWLVSAVSAPVAIAAASCAWPLMLCVGIACGALCWLVHALSDGGCCRVPWVCVLQLGWAVVACGTIAIGAGACWPSGDSYPAVPLVLLTLAGFSAWDGAERASRVSGVLFWFLALLFAVVLAGGIKDLEPKWMLGLDNGVGAELVFLLLIPAAATAIPRKTRGVLWAAFLALALFAAVVSFVCAGTLSPQVAANVPQPFYEYSKSLSLLGVVERFESLVSVALTMGYYSAMSLLLSAAGHLAETLRQGSGRKGVLFSSITAGAMVLLETRIPGLWLAIFAIGFWSVLPLFVQGVQSVKNTKKNEKKA